MTRRSFWTLLAEALCLAAFPAFAAPTSTPTPEDKTPAQWIAQLGADHLWDRDAASSHLLTLGSLARPAVQAALNSPDPEIRFRARDLWQTLRWQVVPGAEADEVMAIVDASLATSSGAPEAPKPPDWPTFVSHHGAATLLLVQQLKLSHASPIVQNAVTEVLNHVPPDDAARFIAASGTEQAALLTLLEGCPGQSLSIDQGVCLMKTELALHRPDSVLQVAEAMFPSCDDSRIYDLAETAVRSAPDPLLLIHTRAPKAILAAKNVDDACTEIILYGAFLYDLNHGNDVAALCTLVPNIGSADDHPLDRLIYVVLRCRLSSVAMNILADAKTPDALYLRTITEATLHDISAADRDWLAAKSAAAQGTVESQQACYRLGETMERFRVPGVIEIWELLAASNPPDTADVANGLTKLAAILEARGDYSRAADLWERWGSIKKNDHSMVFLIKEGNKVRPAYPDAYAVEQTKRLRALAASSPVPSASASPAWSASP